MQAGSHNKVTKSQSLQFDYNCHVLTIQLWSHNKTMSQLKSYVYFFFFFKFRKSNNSFFPISYQPYPYGNRKRCTRLQNDSLKARTFKPEPLISYLVFLNLYFLINMLFCNLISLAFEYCYGKATHNRSHPASSARSGWFCLQGFISNSNLCLRKQLELLPEPTKRLN